MFSDDLSELDDSRRVVQEVIDEYRASTEPDYITRGTSIGLVRLSPRAYEEKRACNLQCILCMRHITDESAGYTIFSQPPTWEIASIREKTAGTEASLRSSG